MAIIIGSARHDEKNGYTNGVKGDSLQTSTPDYRGEVSMQTFYVHKRGWNVIRAKNPTVAEKIAANMKDACNNKNLGYSQSDRYGVIKNGIHTTIPSNCDCSSLVRACVKEASGKDPGDFTTSSAAAVLLATGLFLPVMPYSSGTMLHTGDILCTREKGHIVVVTDGNKGIAESSTPINGNPYKEPTKDVRFNTKGNDARWLQYYLNKHGAHLYVDGIAGEKTITALKDFQRSHGLDPDGVCGELTKKALKSI